MAVDYAFHPEALSEYADATDYYLSKASPSVADRFVAAVESAIAAVVADPMRWRIVETPEIRRCILGRFPFVILYRWELTKECVTIYAVMHSNREPGYWLHRVSAKN